MSTRAATGCSSRPRRRHLHTEQLTDEHRMMARTARDFVTNEILPRVEHLEARSGTSPAGSSGGAASWASWAWTCPRSTAAWRSTRQLGRGGREHRPGALLLGDLRRHDELVIMPLVMFGTEEQKQKYLTKLVSGESSAPTASANRTQAPTPRRACPRHGRRRRQLPPHRREDVLSNCNFADVYVVFAKVTASSSRPSSSSAGGPA